MRFSLKNQKGFSLVELMIVVGIIGILATLALPRFKQFQAKAKMGEAKNLLSHIYTLEQTYSLDNNSYIAVAVLGADVATTNTNICTPAANSGAAAIGFKIDPCQRTAPVPRYAYDAVVVNATFVARAVTGAANFNRVCPGNDPHWWAISDGNVLWGGNGAAPGAALLQTAAVTDAAVGAVCAN